MTPMREMFSLLAEAFESSRKFTAFLGLLAGIGMLKKGIAVAQNPAYPHGLTLAWLAGGFVLGSACAISLYWMRSSEGRTKDADTVAMDTLAHRAELERQMQATKKPGEPKLPR